MGLNVDRDHFEEDDYARFSQRLREDMRALAELFTSVRIRRAMVPVMMTVSAAIARSDCLFYAMQKR